jgi:hypothetical protein
MLVRNDPLQRLRDKIHRDKEEGRRLAAKLPMEVKFRRLEMMKEAEALIKPARDKYLSTPK